MASLLRPRRPQPTGGPDGSAAGVVGTLPAVRVSRRIVLTVVVGALALAACGSKSTPGSSSATTPPTNASGTTGGHVAIPVKSTPSISAKMICESEVKNDLSSLLGVQPTQPIVPTWKDHVYSCTYHYKGGALTLAVKELPDKASTDAYFDEVAQKLGKSEKINGLGQGAYTTSDKSAVVRKDYKVLLVDISKLPAQFGNPPDSRENIALNVAATILGCWTGA
jgi:hypothetical protein